MGVGGISPESKDPVLRALICFCGGGEWWPGSLGGGWLGLGRLPLPSLPSPVSASAHLRHALLLPGTAQPSGLLTRLLASVPGGIPEVMKQPGEAPRPLSDMPTTVGVHLAPPYLSVRSPLPGGLGVDPNPPDLASVSGRRMERGTEKSHRKGRSWALGWGSRWMSFPPGV